MSESRALQQLSLFCANTNRIAREGFEHIKNIAKEMEKIALIAGNMYANEIGAATFLPFSLGNICAAWPSADVGIRRVAYKAVPLMAVLAFVVECAAKKGIKITLPNCDENEPVARQVEVKKIQKFINSVKTGAGTGYFTLTNALAVGMGVMEVAENTELSAVYVSNAAYLGGFVASSAVVGGLHGYLDYTKPTEQSRESHSVRQCVEDMVTMLSFASTANSLIALFLSPLGIEETGSVDPLIRLYLFVLACLAALGPMYIRHTAAESTNEKLDSGLNFLSGLTVILTTILAGSAIMGEADYYTMLGTFAALFVGCMAAGAYFHHTEAYEAENLPLLRPS